MDNRIHAQAVVCMCTISIASNESPSGMKRSTRPLSTHPPRPPSSRIEIPHMETQTQYSPAVARHAHKTSRPTPISTQNTPNPCIRTADRHPRCKSCFPRVIQVVCAQLRTNERMHDFAARHHYSGLCRSFFPLHARSAEGRPSEDCFPSARFGRNGAGGTSKRFGKVTMMGNDGQRGTTNKGHGRVGVG